MSELVQAIKNKLPSSCIVETCVRRGCRVNLNDAPAPNVIVDFDKPGSPLELHDIRCDYLFVANGNANKPGWVVPLELTGGRKHETTAISQLQAGADAAEKYIPREKDINFRPVVVGKLKNKTTRTKKQLKKGLVKFRDIKEPLIRIDAGKPLSSALTT